MNQVSRPRPAQASDIGVCRLAFSAHTHPARLRRERGASPRGVSRVPGRDCGPVCGNRFAPYERLRPTAGHAAVRACRAQPELPRVVHGVGDTGLVTGMWQDRSVQRDRGHLERFVRATFPGLELGGRLLLLQLAIPAVGIGIGVSLIKLGSRGASSFGHVAAIVGGVIILALVLALIVAYAVTLVRSIRSARSDPHTGRHTAQ
jgi:hypothetical protein